MAIHMMLASMLLQAADGPGSSMDPAIAVSWPDLALAGALVLLAVGISAWQRLGLARGFLIGGIRAVVQLYPSNAAAEPLPLLAHRR